MSTRRAFGTWKLNYVHELRWSGHATMLHRIPEGVGE
jgi:hypothetical protein